MGSADDRPLRYRLHGPGAASLEPFEPGAPEAGELLVAPDAVGVCATDLEIADGVLVYFRQGLSSFPLTPGHEWTGIVIAVGDGVIGFAPGDRVVGEVSVGCSRCPRCVAGDYHQCPDRTETGIVRRDGALAQAMRYPAEGAYRLPTSVDRLDAVLLEPLAIANRAIDRAPPAGGSDVLVVGAGPIGLLVVASLLARGAGRVAVAEPNSHRRSLAEALGAEPFDQSVDGGPRADVDGFATAFECSGSPAGLRLALSAVRTGADVVAAGLSGRDEVGVPVDELVVRELRLIGTLSSPHAWPTAIDLVASGRVQPSRLISHRFGLGEVERAFATVRERAAGTVKVVVEPQTRGGRRAAHGLESNTETS